MPLDRDEVAEGLNELITLNKDSAKGFVRAENDVEDASLARWFNRLSEERADLVDDLQREVNRLGEEAAEEASTSGALERGWLNIKAAMTIERDKTDAIVLADRMEHEADVLAAYEDALAQPYPPPIAELLQKQQAYVDEVAQKLARRRDQARKDT